MLQAWLYDLTVLGKPILFLLLAEFFSSLLVPP
jgi:hypothetical protein